MGDKNGGGDVYNPLPFKLCMPNHNSLLAITKLQSKYRFYFVAMPIFFQYTQK